MSNVDINGIARGACTECNCKEFLSEQKVRCGTCNHVPNKHSQVNSTSTEQDASYNPFSQSPQSQDSSYRTESQGSVDSQYGPSSQLDTGYEYLTNATLPTDPSSFQSSLPSLPPSSLGSMLTDPLRAQLAGEDNTDARGIARGGCMDSMCDCKIYQRPASGSKCATCRHSPTKHTNTSSKESPHHKPISHTSGNHQEISESIVSAKINLTPLTGSFQTDAKNASHQVMTSFRSDPPNVVTVSADNSLVVPSNQPVKITFEISIVPKSV